MSDLRTTIAGWVNAGLTLAAVRLSITIPEILTVLFVTIPAGIWSWWKVLDRWQERKKRKHGTY